MRCLKDVTPTAEQLSIVSRNRPGIEVIRGAAGSGKTTTALLRLRSLIGVFLNRRQRQAEPSQVKVLVLTYNRTLRGYIQELVDHQISTGVEVSVEVSTFAKWAYRQIKPSNICNDQPRAEILKQLARESGISLDPDFVVDEVEYLLGRFSLDKLEEYIVARRDGRGSTPRVERSLREVIMQKVVRPYLLHLSEKDILDWNQVAMQVMTDVDPLNYDIIICDEVQDFTANQIRAVKKHSAEVSSLTFIVDTAQRIYARGFTWAETGITLIPTNSIRLSRNYRNTQQIAAFAASIVDGIPTDVDSTIPDFHSAAADGELPILIQGKYSDQVSFALNYIKHDIDLVEESVAFLHPKGRGWFNYLEKELKSANLSYIDITRLECWPAGSENIALSTLHSSKGLEFDHVIILGLSNECMPAVWEDDADQRFIQSRKLLAMGIGRAKKSVTIGYKPEDKSEIIDLFDSTTYQVRNL